MDDRVLLLDLLLVRHAESMANAALTQEDDFENGQDSGLSPRGVVQSEALGRYLKKTPVDAVYTSGLLRTAQTGYAVALRQKNKQMFILPDACEIGISPLYKGRSFDELRQRFARVELKPAPGFDEDSTLVVPDETPGENEERYFRRAGAVIDLLRGSYKSGETVVLVSHAGFLTYIIFHLLGFSGAQPNQDFRLSNTGITRVMFYEPGTNPYGDTIFECVNDRKHITENYLAEKS